MSSLICWLSPELHHSILSNLDLRTLQQCRLVKRQWRDIGNEYFLPAVRLREPKDLLRLLAIAQHDCISRYVRSITFTADVFGNEQQEPGTEDEESDRQSLSVQEIAANLRDGDTSLLCISRLLHRFQKLEKLTISDGQSFETIEWEWIGHNLTDVGRFAVHENAVARQLVVLQAALARASIRLDELCAEWLDTSFFLSKAAEIGQIWSSLKVLRLGIVHDRTSRGIGDLREVLGQLNNMRQLHLSSVGPCPTHLESIVDNRWINWNRLTVLTLRRFVIRESTLRWLLDIPSIKSISLRNMALDADGCWMNLLTNLREKEFEEVWLSGWLANGTMDGGWGGDSNVDGDLLQNVAEWLMRDARKKGECPLTTENMTF
jgi:hypothetical protein